MKTAIEEAEEEIDLWKERTVQHKRRADLAEARVRELTAENERLRSQVVRLGRDKADLSIALQNREDT